MSRRGSTRAGVSPATDAGDGSSGGDTANAPPKRYLNGRITKLHNVRAEPIRDAKVVGYLIATKEASLGFQPRGVACEGNGWVGVDQSGRARSVALSRVDGHRSCRKPLL